MAVAAWPTYRLFPYERRLAEREAAVLADTDSPADGEGILVPDGAIDVLVDRSTYFRSVTDPSGVEHTTAQAGVEAVHHDLRQSSHSRQATRFGLHGVHEYKGKFNPQLVRAFTNIADADADTLIDPFCGSGTSLLEGCRLGLRTLGVEMSPIARFIAEAKTSAATTDEPQALRDAFESLASDVVDAAKAGQESTASPHLAWLEPPAVDYVTHWFPEASLGAIAGAVNTIRGGSAERVARMLAYVSVSSVLRQVSYQLPEDLRIRRRPLPFDPPPMHELLRDATDSVLRGLDEIVSWPHGGGTAIVREGSADDPGSLVPEWDARRRLIVTSPPYATALPYIDTDRLSIVVLGLASSKDLRRLEMDLVGSREWNKATHLNWRERLDSNSDGLPSSIVDLARSLQAQNRVDRAGFRREALPGLLYRYFSQMGGCFRAWATCQTRGERAVVIVGTNTTKTSAGTVLIDTPSLLADVAQQSGYDVDEIVPLETWPRYGLHSRNGVNGESAIVMTRI